MMTAIWFIVGFVLLVIYILNTIIRPKLYDGEIIKIYDEDSKIRVKYNRDGKFAEADALIVGREYEKLEIGVKVLVSVNDKKGISVAVFKKNGKDTTFKNSQRACIIGITACFIMGIISLFN